MGNQLCGHKMNPLACPICFRQKPAVVKAPEPLPGIRPGIPMAPVMGIGEATMRATQARARAQPLPTVQGGKQLREPYSSSNHAPPPEAYSGDELWKPPIRKDLIDQQPVHPHLDKSNGSYK